MLQGWWLLARCMFRATFCAKGTPIRFTRNRLLNIYFYLPIVAVIAAIHSVGLLLDELFFPAYRNVQVKAPLFIAGPPRSGTTFLHRVLAQDTQRFTCLAFAEMVFAPSIIERKFFAWCRRIDTRHGSPVERWLRRTEAKWFDPYADMHRVSLWEPEEDFVLLGYLFANHLLLVLFPFLDMFGHLWHSDWETPPAEKQRLFPFYRRCLQRHLYYHGADKTFLSKNPFFTSMIQSLLTEFPDAKILCNIRLPYATVASFLSVWRVMYDGMGNDPHDYLAQEFILDWLLETYRYGSDQVAALPEDRAAIALYDELVGAPKATILKYYDAFGYAASADFLATLNGEEEKSKTYKSRHQYHLEKYGLDEAKVYDRFRLVFERFNFSASHQEARGTVE